MTRTTNSVFNPTIWSKPFLIRAVGEDTYLWWHSREYKDLIDYAQSLSPGKSIVDGRTKACKYLNWHEPRARTKWLVNKDVKWVR